MVRTFRIAQPDDSDIPLIQTFQYNDDEDPFAEHSFDCIFEMNDNKLFPLGIQFIFFLAGITIQFC